MQTGIHTETILAQFPSLTFGLCALGLAPPPTCLILVPAAVAASTVLEINGRCYRLSYQSVETWEALDAEARPAPAYPDDGGGGFFALTPL